ncbi:MAG: hypothetical protein WC050_04010 [Candidatus Paceibacterota bacterium]
MNIPNTPSEKTYLMATCVVIALVSGTVLTSQLLLSTVLGIAYYYDFRFVSISIALLGFGLGGVGLALLQKYARQFDMHRALLIIGAVYAVTLLAPFEVARLFQEPALSELMAMIALALCNYFLAGALVSGLLVHAGRHIPLLYACDVLGASILGIGSVFIADLSGLSTALALLLCSGLLAVFFLAYRYRSGWGWRHVVLGLLMIGSLVSLEIKYPFSINCPYDHWEHFARSTNSFSQVDLYEMARIGDVSYVNLTINCSIPTVTLVSSTLYPISRSNLDKMRSLPFAIERPADTLIIGSGGGADVERALEFGGTHVTAVELNPLIPRLLQQFRPGSNTYPYGDPRITLEIGDGRSYVAQHDAKYDMIILAMVKNFGLAWKTQLSSMQYLYTKEAFGEYLRALSDDGTLVLLDWEKSTPQYVETLRALLTKMSLAFEDHVMIFSGTEFARNLIIVKKNALTAADVRRAEQSAAQYGARRVASTADFTSKFDKLRPTTDDKPLIHMATQASEDGREQDRRSYSEPIPLWMMLSFVLLGTLLLVFRHTTGRAWNDVLPSFFFIAISCGLAALEFVALSKATLILGHPMYAYAVTTAAIMSGAGIGALFASRYRLHRHISHISIVAACILLAYFALGSEVNAAIHFSTTLKVVLIFVAAAVPGLIAGGLFPLALQMTRERGEAFALWFWSIDAVAFVVASLVIVNLVPLFGINAVSLFGAFGYASAAFFARSLPHDASAG